MIVTIMTNIKSLYSFLNKRIFLAAILSPCFQSAFSLLNLSLGFILPGSLYALVSRSPACGTLMVHSVSHSLFQFVPHSLAYCHWSITPWLVTDSSHSLVVSPLMNFHHLTPITCLITSTTHYHHIIINSSSSYQPIIFRDTTQQKIVDR